MSCWNAGVLGSREPAASLPPTPTPPYSIAPLSLAHSARLINPVRRARIKSGCASGRRFGHCAEFRVCAAPLVVAGAVVLLLLSPLAIPLLPVLLVYWYREKRAGRPLSLRWRFGNESAELPESPERSAPEENAEALPRGERL